MKTYSQLGQDTWVLHHTGNKCGGVFVDVGAFDGWQISNTFLLEREYGWTGTCVEANAEVMGHLLGNRQCTVINKAAWSTSGDTVRFTVHPNAVLSGVAIEGTVKLQTISLNEICEGLGTTDIDYISLDTEGSEQRILSTFDMDRFNVQCWTVEHNFDGEVISFLMEFFRRHDYLWRIVKHDIFAVKDGWKHGGWDAQAESFP